MKLVIIFGPQAVWKMTIGHELEKVTDLKLFHNHMTIELVAPFFSYSSKTGKRLVRLFRKEIFEAVAESDMEWLIFTYIRAFDQQSDRDFIDNLYKIFESKWAEIFLVELEANIDERLRRNKTPHRLNHKPTKKNIEWSEKHLKDTMKQYRLNSKKWEIKRKNYTRIDNTNLSAKEVAKMIKEMIY